MYEVELKFSWTSPVEPLFNRLQREGAVPSAPVVQVDTYFAHPQRDFAQTDEAVRLRRTGPRNVLTYKGPVVDRWTKTRLEHEVAVADGPAAADALATILSHLGFRPVRHVRKIRHSFHLQRDHRDLEIAVDRVEELGDYVEIETLATEADRAAAQEVILAVAADLGLTTPERRSYLCLLLERDRGHEC